MSYVEAQIIVDPSRSTTPNTCFICGFDAMITYPVTLIHEYGVTPTRGLTMCIRCVNEGIVDAHQLADELADRFQAGDFGA